jgi:hypothetical protein
MCTETGDGNVLASRQTLAQYGLSCLVVLVQLAEEWLIVRRLHGWTRLRSSSAGSWNH